MKTQNPRIALFNTDDFTGGAAIACRRLLKALLTYTNPQVSMWVQEGKSGQEGVKSLLGTWLARKMAWLRFVLERLYFMPFEKNAKVRFLFNVGYFGIDISKTPVVQTADIIHLHWVNFGFLSTNSLQQLFKTQKPVVWTLHDMWAFTGGCHHSSECEQYQQSCGNCTAFLKNPSPTDLSHQVWERKKKAFVGANLTVVTCSQWLANRAKKSSLLQGIKVVAIPNPIDIQVFKPLDKSVTATVLGLDTRKKYILFAAMRIDAPKKGFDYFKQALSLLYTLLQQHKQAPEDLELLILGQSKATDFEDFPFKINPLGRLTETEQIVKTYNVAHVFVTPSLEENLPNTIMESLACGTPSVGFEVGGIPEMIDHQKTGYLAQYKNANDLAKGIFWTLYQSDYQELSQNARKKVVANYAEEVVAKQYAALYNRIIE